LANFQRGFSSASRSAQLISKAQLGSSAQFRFGLFVFLPENSVSSLQANWKKEGNCTDRIATSQLLERGNMRFDARQQSATRIGRKLLSRSLSSFRRSPIGPSSWMRVEI